jgi:hypothetical protein
MNLLALAMIKSRTHFAFLFQPNILTVLSYHFLLIEVMDMKEQATACPFTVTYL